MVNTISKPVYFLLRGFIILKISSISIIPRTPQVGQPFSITITLINIGTTTAYAVSATPILEGLPVEVFGEESVFIGNIVVNTPTVFTINLILGNTTKNTIEIPIKITYMDNLRTEHSITFKVTIRVLKSIAHSESTKVSRESNIMWYPSLPIILLVSIVIVVILYMLKRFKR